MLSSAGLHEDFVELSSIHSFAKISLYACLSYVVCTFQLAEYRRIEGKYKCWHR